MPRPQQSSTSPDASPRPRAAGGAGTLISAGVIHDLDPNTAVRGDKWYGSPFRMGIASRMMRDAHVRRSVDALMDPILGATWGFKPASKDPLDIEIADFCSFVFFECVDWMKTLRHALDYIRDGFSLLEATDRVREIPRERFPNHKGRGLGIVYTGFHQRPSWTLDEWLQSPSDPTKLRGITQCIQGSDNEISRRQFVNANRLVRMTWEQDGAEFDGFPVLRSAYGPWKIKILMQTLDAMWHERAHVGTPSLRLPQDASEEDIADASEMMAYIKSHEQGYMILPFGYEFSWNPVDGQTTDIGKTIDRSNTDIAMNVGTGFMRLGSTPGSTGSFALAQSQQGQYALGLDKHARFIESAFNKGQDFFSPVERIVRVNYGAEVGLPKLVARNLPTRDWVRLLPMLHNLTTSGLITADDKLEEHIREVTFLPPSDPDTRREPQRGPSPLGRDATLPMEDEEEPEEPDTEDEENEDEEEE